MARDHIGQKSEYQWLVSQPEIRQLDEIVARFHLGLRLCVTSFDSGPLRLTKEEFEQGWTTQRGIVVSPPIEESLVIPHDQYDEWYVFENSHFFESDIEVFVNYGAFTLVPPIESFTDIDPTLGKSSIEWLVLAQERFWAQLQRLHPMTFVACGDNDIVVSRDNSFFEAVRGRVVRNASNS
jgi:hypothetical protein